MSPGLPTETVKGHVLVVDDEPVIQDLLTKVLVDEGFRVTTALDVETGRLALEAGHVDLLIADLNLRGGRGDEFCVEAKGLRPALRSILMTGDRSADKTKMREQARADLVLFKPFSLHELLLAVDVIRAALDLDAGLPGVELRRGHIR